MNGSHNDSYLFIALVIIILIALPFNLFQYLIIKQKDKVIEKFDLFYLDRNKKEFNGGEVTGLSYGDFFAVWAKDRSYSEIMETCSHEWAHSIGMVHS